MNEKRNFRLDMHLACGADDLRPVMTNVRFKDGYMIATDAHILIKAKLEHFTDFASDEIALLEDKFINRHVFKRILSCREVRVTPEGIEDCNLKTLYRFNPTKDKYPNIDAVIPKDEDQTQVNEIGMNPVLFSKVCNIISCSNVIHCKVKFFGKDRAIIINSINHKDDELIGLIMPVKLNK